MFNGNNVIFSTHWSDESITEKYITVTRGVGNKFFESQKLDFSVNVVGFQSINPFVSSDGKWLYFSSDKPGTLGGLDLWKVEIDENGNTMGESKNLGNGVLILNLMKSHLFIIRYYKLYFLAQMDITI